MSRISAVPEAFSERPELTQHLLDVAPTVLYVYDLVERRNVWGNREVLDLLGYSRAELDAFGDRLLDILLHPDDLEPYAQHRQSLLRLLDGEAQHFEYRMHRADGSWLWLHSREMVFRRTADGAVAQIIGAALDITARREAEAGLRQSEARLRAVFDNAAVGIATLDREGHWLEVNDAVCKITGYAREALLKRTFADITHPDDLDDLDAEWALARRLLAGEISTYSMEKRYLRPDGSLVWVNLTVSGVGAVGSCEQQFVSIVEDITQRKVTEAELHDNRERLQAALDGSGAGTFRWNLVTNELRWDGNVDRLFGLLSAQSPRSLPDFIAYVHPEDRDTAVAASARSVSVGADFDTEFRVIHPGGAVRWLSAVATTFRDAAGRPAYVTGMCMDVTDRKRAQIAVAEANERATRQLAELEMIYEAAPLGLCMIDTDLRYRRINSRLAEMNGHPVAYHIGRRIDEVVPAVYEQAKEVLQRVLDTGQPVHAEFLRATSARPDVPSVWSERWYPLRDAVQRIIAVGVTVEEITERRKAEESLRQRERELRSLADNLPDVVARFDRNLRHIFVNAAIERASGAAQAQVVGKTPRELWPRTELSDRWELVVRGVFASGEPRSLTFQFDTAVGVRLFDAQMIPEHGADGEVETVLVISRDVTEATRSAAEIAHAKDTAEAANAAKDRFLAVLSHELRTPLSPVRMLVSAWEQRRDLPAELKDELAMLRRNIDLECRLIDDMLDLNRIARGKLELQFAAVDLHDEVRHAVRSVESDARLKQIVLECELGTGSPRVVADAARIQQVLWNLLKNAVKFTPPGGRIQVRTYPSGEDAVAVEVSDSGVGIEPSALSKVFQAFEQGSVEVTRQFGGLGLGLAISKAIADMHGGALVAESAGRGAGATFRLTLKLSHIDRAAATHPLAAPSTDAAPTGSGEALRILLVEDHEDTARLMANLLEVLGYRIRTASCVQEGLRAFETEAFDLIISDLGLPDGSGNDLIRKLSATHQVKAIALSGYGMQEDIRRTREAGFAAHLAKPVNLEQLEVTIRRVVGRGREVTG